MSRQVQPNRQQHDGSTGAELSRFVDGPWIGPVDPAVGRVDKYPMPKPVVMARYRGQMELFPLPEPLRVAYQLRLSLIGGYWWGLVSGQKDCIRLSGALRPHGLTICERRPRNVGNPSVAQR
jgi:hypothetical protein